MGKFQGELGQGRGVSDSFKEEMKRVKKLKSQGKDPYKHVGNLR